MLAIADAERPVGLAGVMGGLDTEIGAGTVNVLIEAAQFDADFGAAHLSRLGLFSPSSFRFERPLDPEATEWASRRCAELILEVAGGTLHPGVIDVGVRRPERPADHAATGPDPADPGDRHRPGDGRADPPCARAWSRSPRTSSSLTFRPPSWRSDLEREIDLIEEVARIHGYEHIPEDRAVPLTSTPRGRRERVEGAIRDALTGAGFDEAVTFSLVEERAERPAQPRSRGGAAASRALQPKRESALRQSLVPSLLAARLHNESHGQFDADLFEIANVYLPRPGEGLPHEPTRLAIVAGRDFRGLKGVVEGLLERLHVAAPLTARPVEIPLFARGRAAELRIGEIHLGYLGEIDPARLQEFELREACSAAELEFDVLLKEAVLVAQHRSLPPFPAVVRDLSLVVARDLPWAELSEAVVGAAGPTLEAVPVPGHVPGRQSARGPAERPLQHGVPAPGADAHRRGGRGRGSVGRGGVRGPVRRPVARLNGSR